MRYYVEPCSCRNEEYKFVIRLLLVDNIECSLRAYDYYKTEQEAIEKCAKLNAMLYPQPYVFIER